MSFPKLLVVLGIVLFGSIVFMAAWKKKSSTEVFSQEQEQALQEEEKKFLEEKVETPLMLSDEELPQGEHLDRLFSFSSHSRLPIVDTVTYSSRVSWLKGRPAWISDYASHYNTSTHFISRSLSRKPVYDNFSVANGDRFNVFREDKDFNFHLLVDLSRSKAWLFYYDQQSDERVLLKSYEVGLGRKDEGAQSGLLTPIGKYSLGDKVAIYRPGVMGYFNNEKTEMIRTFGTRWIPFEEELEGCSEPARGFGIHGVPWEKDNATGKLIEDLNSIGSYSSDGCIRFKTEDIEEIYSIVISKPTVIELVSRFEEAKLPGKEASFLN